MASHQGERTEWRDSVDKSMKGVSEAVYAVERAVIHMTDSVNHIKSTVERVDCAGYKRASNA
jgi:hypothetical protein